MTDPIRATSVPDIASLGSLEGKEIGPSAWLEIDQERIDRFAEATGDTQWIHVDAERARRESPFGTIVAHGCLTFALAPMLLQQILQVENAFLMINPGIEKLRFRAPVRVGARLRMGGVIRRVRRIKGGAAHASIHIAFEVEGEPRPAAFGDVQIVYYPQPE